MPGIFVSYRRADSASEVGRIVEGLSTAFGKKRIFNDVFDIGGGERFRETIKARLGKCNVVLVVIGNQWVRIQDESGNSRLQNPDDYVRMEVELALANKACSVIPVLVNRQTIPKKDDLPAEIQDLVERNAVNVRPDPDFSTDMEVLCKQIAIHVPRKKYGQGT